MKNLNLFGMRKFAYKYRDRLIKQTPCSKTAITKTSSLKIYHKGIAAITLNPNPSCLIETQRNHSGQFLEILRCCTDILTDENQNDVANDIWNLECYL